MLSLSISLARSPPLFYGFQNATTIFRSFLIRHSIKFLHHCNTHCTTFQMQVTGVGYWNTMTRENISVITLLVRTDVGSAARVSCHISALVSVRWLPSGHEEAFAAELCRFPLSMGISAASHSANHPLLIKKILNDRTSRAFPTPLIIHISHRSSSKQAAKKTKFQCLEGEKNCASLSSRVFFASICIHNCFTLSSNSLINDAFVGTIELWLSHKAAAAWVHQSHSAEIRPVRILRKDRRGLEIRPELVVSANRNVTLMNNWYQKVGIYHG